MCIRLRDRCYEVRRPIAIGPERPGRGPGRLDGTGDRDSTAVSEQPKVEVPRGQVYSRTQRRVGRGRPSGRKGSTFKPQTSPETRLRRTRAPDEDEPVGSGRVGSGTRHLFARVSFYGLHVGTVPASCSDTDPRNPDRTHRTVTVPERNTSRPSPPNTYLGLRMSTHTHFNGPHQDVDPVDVTPRPGRTDLRTRRG